MTLQQRNKIVHQVAEKLVEQQMVPYESARWRRVMARYLRDCRRMATA